MYDTILIPTDGGDHAVRAAEHGLALAAVFDADVHVISVVDLYTDASVFDAGGVLPDVLETVRAEGNAAIDSIVGMTERSVETAIIEGDPEAAILDYATSHDVDLLVMGTHGRSGISRHLAGSVCEQAIRHASMPVMSVRATADSARAGEYDDLLVPTDGSETAAAAIEHAISIARATDARIHAVNVIDLGDVAAHGEYAIPTGLMESLTERGETATAAVAERAREAGLDAVTAVSSGYPARELLAYAEDNGIDLITMGTAGRTGVRRFLVGSTTERLVRHADVPVLTVNARDRPA